MGSLIRVTTSIFPYFRHIFNEAASTKRNIGTFPLIWSTSNFKRFLLLR